MRDIPKIIKFKATNSLRVSCLFIRLFGWPGLYFFFFPSRAVYRVGFYPDFRHLELAFKTPLKSGDEFVSKLYMKKEGMWKYCFQL